MTGKWKSGRQVQPMLLHAIANRPQQEGRKVRMIRRLGIGFAGTTRRLGAAE